MNAQVLIDAIVRQTMVLIAQLSTMDGARSPLSRIADHVFVSLVRELEGQGLRERWWPTCLAWPCARIGRRCSA